MEYTKEDLIEAKRQIDSTLHKLRETMASCIECAKTAGYSQLELSVVAENARAFSMYKKVGFIEYGRNPKGFNSRKTGFQEVIYMRLEL